LYKLIAVEGPDALGFLQGQLTQDVGLVGTSAPLPAAWCNPKGRVFVTLQLVSTDDGYGLIVPAAMAERVIQRLTMYRLRARVRIELASDELPAGIETDPAALIRAGIATIDDTNSETFTPHMLNLDKLGAISFDKGCYTGQEVVARTEHLGKSKRRAMRYQADAEGIAVGDKLSDGERNVGEVVNVAGRDLLAVTPIELHDSSLCRGNITVTPMPLPYGL
jgi:hypothetical protein